ncbi:unnamed protein product [Adineta steineri]|uniref:Uncharacterized protein n=2 Tax=Adineta steineri TaxID=433720 RepID=A0A819P1X8_9BILA|nr:unnamed protein product [Adineta steineri]
MQNNDIDTNSTVLIRTLHPTKSEIEQCHNITRSVYYQVIHLTTGIVMKQACSFYERCGFKRGQIFRYTIDINELISKDKKNVAVDNKKIDKITKFFGTPVVFNTLNDLTDSDWEQINQPKMIMEMKSKYFYIQNFWMKL